MRLPLNCTIDYFPDFLSPTEASGLFQAFVQQYKIADCRIRYDINGKPFESDFGKITVVDEELHAQKAFPEAIYGASMIWPSSLRKIKDRIEERAGRTFQFCVCIYYPDGQSGVDFHSDPPAFGDTTVIPSLSLGEEREFLLKEIKTGAIHTMELAAGSLLIMGEHCQERYQHCLPINEQYKHPRINMTFRQYAKRH